MHLAVARPAVSNDSYWPIPGLPGPLRNLTMAGRARASKVSLPARLRTHALGHFRSLVGGSLLASHLAMHVQSVTKL